MEVSWNGGTPKSSTLIGFSIINQPFWGSPIYGTPQMDDDWWYHFRNPPLQVSAWSHALQLFSSLQPPRPWRDAVALSATIAAMERRRVKPPWGNVAINTMGFHQEKWTSPGNTWIWLFMDIVEEYITTITRKHNHPQGNEEYMDIELKSWVFTRSSQIRQIWEILITDICSKNIFHSWRFLCIIHRNL